MYRVSIWVPTKGWKLIGKKRALVSAITLAEQFEPLQVQVESPDDSTYWGGVYHESRYDVDLANKKTLREQAGLCATT